MIAHYLSVARAFVEVAIPWSPALIPAVAIMRAPDLLTRYRIWRRHRILTARGMR